MIRIEEAIERDIPQLCELLDELFCQEADFCPDHEKQTAGLRLILRNPDLGRIFVAREGEFAIAMINVLFVPGRYMRVQLEDVIVRQSRRGEGWGRLLLEHAISFSEAHGCSEAMLLTDRNNDRALKFYRRSGFASETATVMRMGL